MIEKTESKNIQHKINKIKHVQNTIYFIPWLHRFSEFMYWATQVLFFGAVVEGAIGFLTYIYMDFNDKFFDSGMHFLILQVYVAFGTLAISAIGYVINRIIDSVREKKELKKLGIKPRQAEAEIERLSKQLANVKKTEKAKNNLDKQQIVSKSKSDVDPVKFAAAQQKLLSQINTVVDSMKKAKTKEETDKLFAKFQKLSLEQDALMKSFKSSTR